MPLATIAGQEVHINDEGFLTEYEEWNEQIGKELAANIGIEMTDDHWALIRFLRDDYKEKGETATTRRVDKVGGFPANSSSSCSPKAGPQDVPCRRPAQTARLCVRADHDNHPELR